MWMVHTTQGELNAYTEIKRSVDDEMKINGCKTESDTMLPKQRLEFIQSLVQFFG
jgi:hypothetical protein